jgi:hypothetical protein
MARRRTVTTNSGGFVAPIYGDLGLPGQRQTVRATPETEYKLPLKQLGALIVMGVAMLGLAVANVLIIGPWLGWSAGLVLAFSIALWLRALTAEQPPPVDAIGIAVGVALVAIWMAWGLGWVELMWWDARCDWPARNKALFVALSAVIEAALALGVYRFAYEIVDPNWPPTIGIRLPELGVMWPGSNKVFVDDEEPETVEVTKEVIRPIPSFGEAHVTPETPLDPERVKGNTHKMMRAPSGRDVLVSDLVTFARLAPTLGTSYQGVWSGRDWAHEQWQDVVDVWHQYGVAGERQPRKTVELHVTDFTEAMRRLSSAFD